MAAGTVTLTARDGAAIVVSQPVHSAFMMLGMGKATEGQQKLCLAFMLDLAGTFDVNPMVMPAEARAFTDGARWVGICVSKLVGGEKPFRLKNLGDVVDGRSDTD